MHTIYLTEHIPNVYLLCAGNNGFTVTVLTEKNMGDGGGIHWLVRMEWRPAGWSVCLPLLISPCTLKSRSSLLAPAHLGGPGKGAVKRLCVCLLKIFSGLTKLGLITTLYAAQILNVSRSVTIFVLFFSPTAGQLKKLSINFHGTLGNVRSMYKEQSSRFCRATYVRTSNL